MTDPPADSKERESAFALVYQELRRIAGHLMSREPNARTLQPTALVNETFLKIRNQKSFSWKSQTHFVALASQAMRQVLVDLARARNAQRRKGQRVEIDLGEIPQNAEVSLHDFLSVHAALKRLADKRPHGDRHSRLVELVWLGGMEFKEAAAELGISSRQAQRDWSYARTWLQRELSGD